MTVIEEFEIVLARSGQTFKVPAGQTILDVLLANGIAADYSCCGGRCGTCEVRVLEGIPDHRDSILLPSERARNKVMMICVSGSCSDRLVLDL